MDFAKNFFLKDGGCVFLHQMDLEGVECFKDKPVWKTQSQYM